MLDWLTVPLSFVNLLGMYLLSRRLRIGWVPTILGEVCWGIYGGYTHQWGLLLGGFVTATVQCHAWMKWRRPDVPAMPCRERGTTGTTVFVG